MDPERCLGAVEKYGGKLPPRVEHLGPRNMSALIEPSCLRDDRMVLSVAQALRLRHIRSPRRRTVINGAARDVEADKWTFAHLCRNRVVHGELQSGTCKELQRRVPLHSLVDPCQRRGSALASKRRRQESVHTSVLETGSALRH